MMPDVPRNRMHVIGQFLAFIGLVMIVAGLLAPALCAEATRDDSEYCTINGRGSLIESTSYGDDIDQLARRPKCS